MLWLSDWAFSVIAPGLFAAQAIAMGVALRRRPEHDRGTWRAWQCGVALLIINSLALPRYRMGQHRAIWGALTVTALIVEMACFTAGAARSFRPFLNTPAATRSVKVGLLGFVLSTLAIQWHLLGERPTGWVGGLIMFIAALGGALILAAVGSAVTLLPTYGRVGEAGIAVAGAVYGVGQAVALLRGGPVIPTASLFIHSCLATGILTAVAFRPEMDLVGRPLVEFTDTSPTALPPVLLIVLVMVDGALAGLALGPWSVSRVVFVLALAVAVQTVAIVWLSRTLLGFLQRLGLLKDRRLRHELRTALNHGLLEAHFQPIVRSADLQVVGYETLVRWTHPRLGLLPAQHFIALAESEGLLSSIDHLMLRRAVEALPVLRATSPLDTFFLTVNVDPVRMQEGGFATRVLADFQRRGLDPTGLIVELTETAAIRDWDELRINVAVFKDAQVGLAVDDFGSGRANFGLLVQLEPNIVKIDQTLVEAAFPSVRGRLVVRNAVAAARSAGAHIIAEGVSDDAWVPTLREMGFDSLQGYVFGKAQAVESFPPVDRRFIS